MNSAGLRRGILAPALAVLLILAGCGVPHPGISNGSLSVCYRAIPPARQAIHDDNATIIGVHRISADRVISRLPAAARSQLTADDDDEVCVVAFRGTFSPGQVNLAPPTEQGSYTVVLLTSRHLYLIASAVLTQLPHSLGGRHL